jgi:type II secretory pathway pseudopilin PulG
MNTAFTLIELLVVILIIMILLTILSPAIGSALNQTRYQTGCLTQLREINTTTLILSDMNKGAFPVASIFPTPAERGLWELNERYWTCPAAGKNLAPVGIYYYFPGTLIMSSPYPESNAQRVFRSYENKLSKLHQDYSSYHDTNKRTSDQSKYNGSWFDGSVRRLKTNEVTIP